MMWAHVAMIYSPKNKSDKRSVWVIVPISGSTAKNNCGQYVVEMIIIIIFFTFNVAINKWIKRRLKG